MSKKTRKVCKSHDACRILSSVIDSASQLLSHRYQSHIDGRRHNTFRGSSFYYFLLLLLGRSLSIVIQQKPMRAFFFHLFRFFFIAFSYKTFFRCCCCSFTIHDSLLMCFGVARSYTTVSVEWCG